ncbi:hypothetical protein OESDEN_20851 [Oesophagostomum dentatum]|uniref:Peptidase S1 domain-containing protein n=1 Tax=Oesophagostomum dentatum TaxID=61180 RepID=A0A0B1S8D5_OESDE|nr:hypothetical protein OESDEN_20851 [Oesophagostomum dentatum]
MLIISILAISISSTIAFECGISTNPQHDKIWRPFRENARKSPISKKIRVLIVGGTAAPPDAWPWHALIKYRSLYDGKLYVCGGSLISSHYILTAAHCAIEMSVDHTVVSIGTTRSSDQSPEATYNVHQFVFWC